MRSMVWTSDEVTKIPGAYFYVPAIAWITIGIYFAVLIALLSGWFNNARRRIFGVMILIVIASGYFIRWQNSRNEIEMTVLPLNGGHGVYIDAAGRKNDWLIDCGNENAAEFTLKPFLRAHGVNQISRLVLTEGDVKHCGGAQLLDELFGVEELWTSRMHFRSSIYNSTVAAFEKSSRHKFLNGSDEVGCWKILHPNGTNNFARSDDNALVAFGKFHSTKILLLADLSRAGQYDLLSRTNDLHADIVVAGLPQEDEPLSEALIEAIQPKIIIIADSEFPATRRANARLRERLARKNVPVIYTRNSSAVTIVSDASGWNLRTMDGQKFNSASFSK
jgi:beta-lactamase superfamily II metal-dependent hydrolase